MTHENNQEGGQIVYSHTHTHTHTHSQTCKALEPKA